MNSGMFVVTGPKDRLERAFDRSNLLTLEQCTTVAAAAINVLKELPWIQQYLEGGAESLQIEKIRDTLINVLKHQASQEGLSPPTGVNNRLYIAAGTGASGFLRYLEEEAPRKLQGMTCEQREELKGQVMGILASEILHEAPNFRSVN